MKNNLKEICARIKIVIFDVDGVLTDGKITICSNGYESKNFSVEDGTGAAIAKFANLPIIFLSGRYSKATEIRASELKVDDCIQGFLDKKNKLTDICNNFNVSLDEIAYVGDGLVDIPVLEVVGLPIAVPNAHLDVKKYVKHITQSRGGEGVLHEVVNMILNNQGRYKDVLSIMKKKIYKNV